MKIIRITPYENGGRPPIQYWSGSLPPDDYATVECDTTAFYLFRGFVDITVTDNICTAITGNQDALNAYLLEHPDAPAPPGDYISDSEALAILLGEVEGNA